MLNSCGWCSNVNMSLWWCHNMSIRRDCLQLVGELDTGAGDEDSSHGGVWCGHLDTAASGGVAGYVRSTWRWDVGHVVTQWTCGQLALGWMTCAVAGHMDVRPCVLVLVSHMVNNMCTEDGEYYYVSSMCGQTQGWSWSDGEADVSCLSMVGVMGWYQRWAIKWGWRNDLRD